MSERRLHEDAAARLRALELASFIVEAPAGAGKTELLTQRYLRLLAEVRHPEEVLALTFTNKAATEMRDRILGSLENVATARPDDLPPHKRQTFDLARAVLTHDARQGWGLLQHPGRLRITTLDALCASLARQMPYLSRFGAQPGVTEDARVHYETAARRTLEMVEDETPDGDTLAAALRFMENDAGRLERLIVALLGRRDQWLHHAGRIAEDGLREEISAGFTALIERDLGELAGLLAPPRQAELMAPLRYAAANLPDKLASLADWQAPLAASIDDLPAWRALAGILLTGKGEFRRSLTKNDGFPAGSEGKPYKDAMLTALEGFSGDAELAAALARTATLPAPDLSDPEWSTVTVFARLLQLAAGQLWLAFQEAGEVDFIEIAARASLALGDDEAPTDLAQALDYRISHLLVDEFQDTSPLQVELLEKLTRGWPPDDGRTLFVVGDPMQSIYRFRKADVGLFLRVRTDGIGDIRLENLRLFRNNRSHPGIVDWVNRTFPQVFPAADSPERGAVRYAESAATRPARADSSVTIHPLFATDPDTAQRAEALRILDLIRSTRRDYPDERIAVLVRARSHLDALVATIRQQAPDLRFQAVDIEGLDGRQHVQDLLILAHALFHRADRINWLALLRAPWCGLTLADLHVLAADDKHSTVWLLMQDETRIARLSADGRQRLLPVREILREALAQQGRQHPRRWLQGVWLMLGGPRCLESSAALADVDAFFALMDELVAAGKLSAEALQQKSGELFAPPDPLAGAQLQMMTIHKSKGLEFDTVILPGLQRAARGNDSSLLLWDEVTVAGTHEHLVVAPLKAKGAGADGPSAYDYLRRLEAERSAHEAERLLYVAATRAIRSLHLLGTVTPDDRQESGMKPPAAATLLGLLWPQAVATAFAAALEAGAASVAETAAGIDPATFVPDLLRLRNVELPAEFATPLPLPAGNPPVEESPAVPLDASVGTLVHRCLELIANEGLEHWSAERIRPLGAAYRRWLTQAGHSSAEAAEGAGTTVSALCRTLDSVDGRWVLARHEAAAAEQAWSSRDERDGEPVAVNHVIDRIFVADGCRWIVDYKTVHVPAGSGEDFLRARAAEYRPQLARYASLFAGDAEPPRLAIFFPLQGVLVELP
ncbi:MAG: UvrD-helicase domain-containing protein [Azonexus sp.]|nr:UvrD-helicase domain-containing protein [Azonexus sp.]